MRRSSIGSCRPIDIVVRFEAPDPAIADGVTYPEAKSSHRREWTARAGMVRVAREALAHVKDVRNHKDGKNHRDGMMIETDRAFPDAELGVTPRSTELRKHMIDTNVSWKVGATEGDKKGKKWFTDEAGNNEVQDHQWMELWDGIQSMSSTERLKFLSEHYEITYQTLQRKVGKAPEPAGRKAPRTSGTGRPQAAAGRSKEDIEAGLEERIDALREELGKSEARLARLREMDDSEYQEMRLLLLG